MKKMFVLGFFIACLNMACGQLKTSNSDGQGVLNSGVSFEDSQDYQDINQKIADVEAAQVDLSNQLSAIDLQGSTNVPEALLTGKVDQLTTVIGKLKQKIEDLKAKINSQLVLLDPNNNANLAMIDKLQNILDYLNQVDGKIQDVLSNVKDRINELFTKVELKIAQKLPAPLNAIAIAAIEKIKQKILDEMKF